MYNKVTLIGNLGKDPERGETDSGHAYSRFSVATSESWKDKNTGERKEKTEWHRVVVWGNGYRKFIHDHVKKGSKVMVEGQLCTRSWEKDGQKRYVTEIVVRGAAGYLRLLSKSESNQVPAPKLDDHGQGDSYESNQYAMQEGGVF